MLRRDVARTAVTIYNFMPSLGTFQRAVIRDCSWKQEGQSNRVKQGLALPDDVTILLPYSYKYVSIQNGGEFDGQGWTIRMGSELEGSYIVKGVCPFLAAEQHIVLPESPRSRDVNTDGETPARGQNWFILTLEMTPVTMDDFVRDVVEPFEAQYDARRPSAINECFEGSRNMWYLEVKCDGN